MIEVRQLRKTFGTQVVLDDISFGIEPGASVAIIGRSGCGKSVLIKHLIGLLKPDQGRVLIDGEDIVPMDERQLLRVRQKFGMVFQGAALFDSMTVAENVAFALRRDTRWGEAEITRRVAGALDMVDLPGIQTKSPAELSGGMRKRVGLARAIVYEPQIVLYDEPTTGLDPIVADSIDQLMLRVRDRLKVTTVVVTHDMRTARRLGQLVFMLHGRRIYANGTPDEVFGSADPVVRQFVDGLADAKADSFWAMDQTRLQTKVGVFVFIGLALLAVLLIQFSKGTNLFERTYTLRLHAANVGGLQPNAAVRLAGVQVGSVSTIHLAPDGRSVTIRLKIRRGCHIYGDARFVIEQSGFLGDQYVAIIPTANRLPVLTNNAIVKCEPPFNLQAVARSASGFIQRIDTTAKKLDTSITDLRRVVLNDQTLTNFALAVGNARLFSEQALGTVKDVNRLVASNGLQINLAVSNVVSFSHQLTRLSEQAGGLLDTNSADLSLAVKNIETSTAALKEMVYNLQSGKGLAGAVLRNEQLATNVQAIASNLAIASSNLNRLGLWGFLWHHEPAPAARTNPAPRVLYTPRRRAH